MNKIKLFFIIIIASLIADNISAKQLPMPVLNIAFWTTPFISDTENHGLLSFNGRAGGGFWFNRWTFSWMTTFNYESAAEHSNTQNNRCSFSITEYFSFTAAITKHFEFTALTGVGWQRLSVQNGYGSITNHNYFILSNIIINDFILPTRYIIPSLVTQFDLFFSQNDFRLKLESFIRITALAYFDFIRLFTDIGIHYEPLTSYSSRYPYFTYQTGISLRLTLKQKVVSKKIVPVMIPEKKSVEKTHEEKKQKQQENFSELYKTIFQKKSPGDTVELDYIYFTKQNDIGPLGLDRINAIAEVLAEKKWTVAIGAYADSLGDADAEMLLAKKRSQKIKELLIARGIPAENIKIKANANVYAADAPNKMIEIKIIK